MTVKLVRCYITAPFSFPLGVRLKTLGAQRAQGEGGGGLHGGRGQGRRGCPLPPAKTAATTVPKADSVRARIVRPRGGG